MAQDYDLIVIGGGPAGYAAAIRATQLGKRVVCVEREHLGGICLNWGCIPTKALLTSAHLVETLKHDAEALGFTGEARWDFAKIIARSRAIAGNLNKGIQGLFRKYKVESIMGEARVVSPKTVRVGDRKLTAEHILIATGARPRVLPGAEFDGKTIISFKEAMSLKSQPKSMIVIGAGAIGMEFTDFYNALGTDVAIIEMQDRVVPAEDEEISGAIAKIFEKRGVKILTSTKTGKVEKTDAGVKVEVSGPKGDATLEADVLLVAIGVTGNVENLFDEGLDVAIERGHIKVSKPDYRTSIPGLYAVGDVIGPPWLAHVAHHEAVCCVERMFGASSREVDYDNIPGCTYTNPGIGSVGLTEKQARERGHELQIGRFPFYASGRAQAAGEADGFVKLIFEAETGELLGAHLLGAQATEMISELVVARKLEATRDEILHIMHPHPTFSESIMEAAGVALGESVHL